MSSRRGNFRCLTRSRPVTGKAAGFTLIEVLLALTLGAVVLAALYASFFMSETAATETGRSARLIFQTRMNLDRIVRELEGLRFLSDEPDTKLLVESLTEYGRPVSSLRFATLGLPGGLRRIAYRLEDGRLLLQIQNPLDKLADNYQEPPWLTLLDEVREFRVEIRLNGRWINSWNSELNPVTPELFRVTLVYGAEENPERISAIARPRIGKRL